MTMGDVFQFSILNPQSLSEEIAEQLSELDKMCVGADGWSADSFRSEAEKDNGYVLYVVDNENVIALLSGYSAV